MVDPKVRLNFLVPGARMLSSQVCEENPKENYEVSKLTVRDVKGSGKNQREVFKTITVRTRKNELVTRSINICEDAYNYMIHTPTDNKLSRPVKFNNAGEPIKRVWDNLSKKERLKKHFDLMAHDFGAKSYTFEILD